MKRRTLAIAGIVGLALLGPLESGHAQEPPPDSPVPMAPSGPGAAGTSAANVVLRPGDVLSVRVWPNTEFSGDFAIEESGNIYLPFLQEVRAAGVSINELRRELRSGYSEAMQNPVVTITPQYRVTVTGEVQRPGVYSVTPTHSLFDVIGMAGGFRGTANQERVRVVREGETVEYDALRALETGEGLYAVELRSGDHIVIPRENPPRITWSQAFTMVRTVSTLFLIWDRFF